MTTNLIDAELRSYSRMATEEDVPSMVSLVNRAFADDNPFLLTNRIDTDEIRGLMQKGHFLLLEAAGTMLSLIYAEIRDEGRGYLGLLVVDPTKHRSGLGGQMLCAGEEFCRERGCRVVEGTVIDRRPDLLERYQRFGFRVVGELRGDRSGHVEGGYSLILIEKDLRDQNLPCP